MACPICSRRKEQRWCPAKGERICAVCCGTEREVTIDCPSDCPYLVAARRYEAQHRKPVPPEEVPYPDLSFPADLIHEHRAAISGMGMALLGFAREHPETVDADVLAGLGALAETYRTLGSGLYYERPPEGGPARGIYDAVAAFLQQFREEQGRRAGFTLLRDGDVFPLLVFLLRIARHETNGRPRSRAFLDFLRAQYPRPAAAQPEEPRIILP